MSSVGSLVGAGLGVAALPDFMISSLDGVERLGRIPGRMKYRTWIEEDDVVVAEPWDWQDEKATIEWRYTSQDANQLRREGHID